LKKDKIEVIELFAGVGGFKLGLEGNSKGKSSSSDYKDNLNSNYKVIWSNQYEPLTKTVQHASEIYKSVWPDDNHSNKDIEEVIENDFKSIPDHDMLVGGFPCQDYSVATTLKNSKGLVGKKGVLWWSIYNILQKKGKKKAKYLILENVDRLLISPSNQKGRDFAVMLSCLNSLGYGVEWKMINAADYGMPQRRKRVFIVAYHSSTKIYKRLLNKSNKEILKSSVLGKAFPSKQSEKIIQIGEIDKDTKDISKNFNLNGNIKPFLNFGFMMNEKYFTCDLEAKYEGPKKTLKSILLDHKNISSEFFIDMNKKLKNKIIKQQTNNKSIIIETIEDKWRYLKGKKNEWKTNKSKKYKYKYIEGSMVFPDNLEKASRTIITGEGGSSPSRFKHVVKQNNKYRRLSSEELEMLNMFPVNHTKHKFTNHTKRAFLMGNALVVGIVEKIGAELQKQIFKF
jgi:DNA (cytosine-5)-methyltransferase 1